MREMELLVRSQIFRSKLLGQGRQRSFLEWTIEDLGTFTTLIPFKPESKLLKRRQPSGKRWAKC